MKRGDAFPSQYVSKDDLPAPRVVTISDVQMVSLKGDNGDESKPAMYFSDFPKPLLVNNVNWMSVEAEYGDDSDSWRGKRVELYVDPNVMFGSKRIGGVRIRMPSAGGTRTTGTAPAGNANGAAAAMRRKAWETFQKDNPGTPESLAADYKARCQEFFGDIPSTEITTEQWQEFIDNSFQPLPF